MYYPERGFYPEVLSVPLPDAALDHGALATGPQFTHRCLGFELVIGMHQFKSGERRGFFRLPSAHAL